MKKLDKDFIKFILCRMGGEFEEAVYLKGHKPFNSYHEGKAVIEEEFEELWEEIKKKNPDKAKLKAEVLQVGAMALRFYYDLLADEN